MKLINKATRNYIAFGVVLEPGKVLEIADSKTINILKTQPGVEEYIDINEVEELKKEVERLKAKTVKTTEKKSKKSEVANKTKS